MRFKVGNKTDADDILQEVYLTAYQKFPTLKNKDSFKAWLISIARNKCNDYFREKAARLEIPIETLTEKRLSYGKQGVSQISTVRETLEILGDKDKQILYLYFWKELPQAEIAKRLDIPVGTVKSRLYTAKRNFKDKYPANIPKGESNMKKLPEILPEYKIEQLPTEPFQCVWEELMGWLIVPRTGEKLSWGLYDMPSRKRTEWTEMEVVGKAEVHGIEGVETVAIQHDAENYYRTGSIKECEWRFINQLTDTHCRTLAESHVDENGVRRVHTFLDGDEFMQNWGYGEDNCGKETHIRRKGILSREGNVITGVPKPNLQSMDVVGRYKVTIGGREYDTVCVMDIETFDDSIVTESYIDKNGRTVLWRRFNHDNWAADRYKKSWSEMLPENEWLFVNGETYVHWYDCITDYIL